MLEFLADINFAGKPVGKADVLDLQIPVDQFQLLLQCDKFLLGNAGPEDGRQIRCQLRDLGHVIGHTQPLHGVQGVIEKMGVQLGLHHADLGVVQFLLALNRANQIVLVFLGHPVEGGCQTAQLVLPVQFHPDVQISLPDPLHGPVHPVHRLGQEAAEPPAVQQAQHHAHNAGKNTDGIESPHNSGAEHRRLLEDQMVARLRLLKQEIAVFPAALQSACVQNPAAQLPGGGGRRGRAGTIHQLPGPVQHQQFAGHGIVRPEQGV